MRQDELHQHIQPSGTEWSFVWFIRLIALAALASGVYYWIADRRLSRLAVAFRPHAVAMADGLRGPCSAYAGCGNRAVDACAMGTGIVVRGGCR